MDLLIILTYVAFAWPFLKYSEFRSTSGRLPPQH